MRLSEKQFGHPGEVVELVRLGWSVVRPNCRFLEIGSWWGESSALLGAVALTTRGKVCCVDTWEGAGGSDLAPPPGHDSVLPFWQDHINTILLGNTCIPVRGRSQDILPKLEDRSFDLIFIDGDHRYDAVVSDIKNARRLIKPGGIICGHDCEETVENLVALLETDRPELGKYFPGYAECHKNEDCAAGLHCGVILAVSEAFPECTIRSAVWSVRLSDSSGEFVQTMLPEQASLRPRPYLPSDLQPHADN